MPELVIAHADSGRSFDVSVGDVITIRLDENPTTGYVWAVDDFDDRVLAFDGRTFELPQEPLVGQGGEATLRFRPLGAGRAAIRLKHWRSWEGDASITERFEVEVSVSG